MAERSRSSKPEWQKEIAEERIAILFREAEKMAKENRLEFSNRYVELARKIGMRYNVKIPKELRARFCRKCLSYLVPEETCELNRGHKEGTSRVKCFKCDKHIHVSS